MTITITGTTITGAVIMGGVPPDTPTSAYAHSATTTAANVSFDFPVNTGSGPIISYTAISSPGNISATITQFVSGTSSTIVVTGLSSATTYTFTVYATNSFGNSIRSNTTNSITTTPIIGQLYGGGYFAGQISTSANGVATHNLVIAPIDGYSPSTYSLYNGTANRPSRIDGPGNTSWLVANGGGFGANFCKDLTLGGYTDWYLPAIDELAVAFINLRPGLPSTGNYNTAIFGPNQYSVPKRTIAYTQDNPTQTSVSVFQTSGSQFGFGDSAYGLMSSTCENSTGIVRSITFINGGVINNVGSEHATSQHLVMGVRAFRRVAI